MSYTEVLTTHGVTAEQWDEGIFEEYLGMIFWRLFMGPSDGAVIQVKEDLMKKPGDAITMQIRSQLKGGHITGRNKGVGNEGRVEFYHQRVTIDNDRQVVKMEDVPMSEQRVTFSVLQSARSALADAQKYQLEDDITEQLEDTANGRVRGRYLYGAVDSNWNATHATALTSVDNTADKLTTTMIDISKRKALIPVNATAKIRPMKVRMENLQGHEEWFVGVFHPYCIRDMVQDDAAWRNAQLNLPPNVNRNSVIFTGSSFKGAWDGTLIYEWDRISLVSSTIQVAHNFVLGAQAAFLTWGQRSKFGEEEADLGHDRIYELHEIRGIAKTVFDRNSIDSSISNEDHGTVHTFAAAVAD
jgi:N4-gp56 family major capsid protein